MNVELSEVAKEKSEDGRQIGGVTESLVEFFWIKGKHANQVTGS